MLDSAARSPQTRKDVFATWQGDEAIFDEVAAAADFHNLNRFRDAFKVVRPATTIWTVGHSTRSAEEFLELLDEHRIGLLGDVRRFPTSKRVPWSVRGALVEALADRGVRYGYFEDLGGYRRPRPNSLNTAWRNEGFRGYADHMATPQFAAAIERLVAVALAARTAIMCAEALPWKCHRSLLSDGLAVRGVRVIHILSAGTTQVHRLTPFARVNGHDVTYPGGRKGA